MLYLHRYQRTQSIYINYFISKLIVFSLQQAPKLKQLQLQAGLYKTNSLMPEHNLILSNLSQQPVQLNFQLHGKRQRKTVSLSIQLQKIQIWPVLDKFVHELIPHMQDLMTPKSKKIKTITNFYTLRIRQKFTAVDDFDDLLENQMHDTHKGIYLPLTINFKLIKSFKPIFLELYFRMLQLPISLFRRKRRPAFDDKVVFTGMEELYRQTSIKKK